MSNTNTNPENKTPNPENKTPNPGTKDALKAENDALKAKLEALMNSGADKTDTADISEERVEITVPRGYANDEPNLLISVNGVNYLLPKGKTSRVPKFIAEEFYRSQAAQRILDDHKDEMLGASK